MDVKSVVWLNSNHIFQDNFLRASGPQERNMQPYRLASSSSPFICLGPYAEKLHNTWLSPPKTLLWNKNKKIEVHF